MGLGGLSIVGKDLKRQCVVCGKFNQDTKKLKKLQCGHLIEEECAQKLWNQNNLRCPEDNQLMLCGLSAALGIEEKLRISLQAGNSLAENNSQDLKSQIYTPKANISTPSQKASFLIRSSKTSQGVLHTSRNRSKQMREANQQNGINVSSIPSLPSQMMKSDLNQSDANSNTLSFNIELQGHQVGGQHRKRSSSIQYNNNPSENLIELDPVLETEESQNLQKEKKISIISQGKGKRPPLCPVPMKQNSNEKLSKNKNETNQQQQSTIKGNKSFRIFNKPQLLRKNSPDIPISKVQKTKFEEKNKEQQVKEIDLNLCIQNGINSFQIQESAASKIKGGAGFHKRKKSLEDKNEENMNFFINETQRISTRKANTAKQFDKFHIKATQSQTHISQNIASISLDNPN